MKPNRTPAAQPLLRAIESNPLDVRLYRDLADVYEAARQFRNANLSLHRALEIEPFDHQTWVRLGIHYMNRGTWRSASDAFEHATRLASSDALSWIRYGLALIAAHNLRGARLVSAKLLERFSDRPDSHVVAGHISKIEGHFAAAADSYRRALELNPDQPEALFSLVDLCPPAPSDPLTKRLETRISAPFLPNGQSRSIRFSLARIYEQAGITDRAFALYREANESAAAMLQGSVNAYDPRRAEEETEQIIQLFGQDVINSSLPSLDLGIRMIFIVGLPRSGTTLIERILSAHSRVSSGGELPFMRECLAKLLDNQASSIIQGGTRLEYDQQKSLLVRIRNEYLDALFESDLDSEYVTDKLPANFSALGLIRILFPDALIVHCIRNPIATCWSLFSSIFDAHLSYNLSFDHLLHYHNNIYARLMRHWKKIDGINIIDVDYDALVADPDRKIGELLNRCGIACEAACFNFQDNDQPIFTASMLQARQPIYSTSVARWRKFERHLVPLIEGLRD